MRLPLTPASVTLLTREGPYADAIKYGQTKVGNGVLDVSIVGGFVFSDTPKNGVAIVINGERGADVRGTALDIAGAHLGRPQALREAPDLDGRRDAHFRQDHLVRCGRQPGRGRHRADHDAC